MDSSMDSNNHSPSPSSIRLILLSNQIEPELHFGLNQFSTNSIRPNLNFIHQNHDQSIKDYNHQINTTRTIESKAFLPSFEEEIRNDLDQEYWWFIKFKFDSNLLENQFKIQTSNPSFHEFSNTSSNHLTDYISSINQNQVIPHFSITITYKRKSEAFRSIGHLLTLTRIKEHDKILMKLNDYHQLSRFDCLGLMIDCSRNGVLKLIRIQELLRFMALMGLNMLQLYTEDTYQIENEPFFGYFRGPYKFDELKEIDHYADSLGIEVIPCIQTLGHLGQMLQWPRYGGMRDTHEVLLVGSEEVYQFIEKMIVSITSPLKSKKIHIGMDEAHGVSEGRYRQLFGHHDSTVVFTNHLRRVNEICKKHELKPMIWSDMLFCLEAKNNSLGAYYDSNHLISNELVQSIPAEIDLVYWDYYHTTPGPYVNKIHQHRQLNFKTPAMASGIWTWSRFWTALPFTIETIGASMKAIKDPSLNVKIAMTTIWGDEGNECDIRTEIRNLISWSALPGLLYFSEHGFTLDLEVDLEFLKVKFDGICGGSFDDFLMASKLDDLQPEHQLIDDKARFTPNLSKWLIWEEPFYSILSPQYAGHDLETHYNELSKSLSRAITNSTHQEKIEYPLNQRLKLPKLIAEVLSLKCHLRDRLVQAYGRLDVEELMALAGYDSMSRLSRLIGLVKVMWIYHRELWMSMYKPFGWEVLELRYGGLRSRLDTMHYRLNEFIQGRLDRLEELEVSTELVYPTSGAVMMLDYHRVSRPQYC
ncbi:family 20 glycoside hydrolase [Melampsora larici-populina 98AG31]|uniref:beta-N-acetylhexosaminidase n=1 Tax=Melampsora larici-populina (strain 98AG31 / pathotype 3-4-7) TaxID=747676 RepID=F4RGT8_MELLP|nr:family 20 glycoside hydrolase [Melampsora larici-populina 98AG31]EGG08336.1 family 20 glycoside hydrolase [Melampsora larici-populina 98AG31]